MYKLLIVDDEPLVQVGIKSMLNWSDLDIEISGIAMNGQAALKLIEKNMPDIVITDIKMPVMTGLDLIRVCRDRYGNHHPAFIILTSYEDFHMAKEALTYQVTDYLVKLELTASTLQDAIDRVLEHLKKEPVTLATKATSFTATDVHLLEEKFFIRLLHNLFDSKEQFMIQCKELSLSFDSRQYICAYIEFVSHIAVSTELSTNESMKKQAGLYNSSLQMLREIVGKYLPSHVVSLDLKHCTILFDSSSEDSIEKPILDCIENISSTLRKYYNVSLRAGVGMSVSQALDIADSYQSARQAFFTTEEQHPILLVDTTVTSLHSAKPFNISLFRDTLSQAYEEYDAELLHATLSEIIELFRMNPGHYLQAMDGACNILYLSISLLPDGETLVSKMFENYPDNYRSIYKQSNMEQIVDWLIFFRDSLCSVFTDHKKDHKNHIVTNVKKYVSSHLADRITLNEVADVFGISPNYLSQLFKKYNDMGFNEYVTWVKIEEAKALLHDSSLKVYEIADQLGFESAFYFSKVFKKVVGLSPSEYQNTLT